MQFSPNDNDNDDNPIFSCAKEYRGAWWYKDCLWSNLNELHLNGPHSQASGVSWRTFGGHDFSLKRTEMKVKKNLG